MSKVIARLMGGLGNQMFQYAAGLALARRTGVPLLLDRTFLDSRPEGMNWTPRAFELDVFRAPIAFATDKEVRHIRRAIDSRHHRRLRMVFPFLYPELHMERGTGFDPTFFDHRTPVYIEGFWQNEHYFIEEARALREELFVPRSAPTEANAELLDAIQGSCSASIHVRRGDYVNNAESNRFHGMCSVDYYLRAASELVELHGVEHFFVFSDDPIWTQANIHLPRPATHIAHNTGREAHWDLFLMKHCRHHILANSSFSWWGAWLHPMPGKVVIAPEYWFQGSRTPSTDIIPSTWTVR